MIRKISFVVISLLLINSLSILPAQAAGAKLAVSPGSVTTTVGATFTVTIQLQAGEAVNSASGTLTWSNDILTALSISQSGSIFTNWAVNPSIASNTANFAGGLPSPGLTGTGKLFTITFKAKDKGSGSISIVGGQTLANDGKGTNIYTGASNSSVTVNEVLNGSTISSSTHPDQSKWYKEKNLKLSWTKPSNAKSFSYTFSKQDGGTIDSGSTNETSFKQDNLADGIYIFQLTTIFASGNKVSSFTVRVDTTPPAAFTLKVEQTSTTDPFPILSYEVTDTPSGIDHYEITVAGQDVITTTEKSYKLPKQNPGKHKVTVKAVDKAGNSTEATAEFTIEGFPGPVITGYPKYVSVLEPVTLVGQGLFEAKIKIFVDDKEQGEFVVKENLTDGQRKKGDPSTYKDGDNVEWTYTYRGSLLPGKHKFYAIQIKPDTSESNPSNEVIVRVLWSSVSIGGVILPLALIVLILLVLLLLLIILLIWLWRRSNRKRPNDSSGWADLLKKLHFKMDNEFSTLKKDIETDLEKLDQKPQALKHQIESEIDQTEANLNKEINQTGNDKTDSQG